MLKRKLMVLLMTIISVGVVFAQDAVNGYVKQQVESHGYTLYSYIPVEGAKILISCWGQNNQTDTPNQLFEVTTNSYGYFNKSGLPLNQIRKMKIEVTQSSGTMPLPATKIFDPYTGTVSHTFYHYVNSSIIDDPIDKPWLTPGP